MSKPTPKSSPSENFPPEHKTAIQALVANMLTPKKGYPHFASVLLNTLSLEYRDSLPDPADPEQQRACYTDGECLFIGPAFFTEYESTDLRLAALSRAVIYNVLNFPAQYRAFADYGFEGQPLDHDKYLRACGLVANSVLNAEGRPMPRDWELDDTMRFPEWSSRSIYKKLLEDDEQKDPGNDPGNQDGGSGGNNGKNPSKQPSPPNDLDIAPIRGDDGEPQDDPTPEQIEQHMANQQAQMSKALAQGVASALAQGHDPASAQLLMGELTRPKVNFVELLLTMLQSRFGRTMRNPKRINVQKWLDYQVVNYKRTGETVAHLGVALDTSGSIVCDTGLLETFAGAIMAAVEEFKPKYVTMVSCDAVVHSALTMPGDNYDDIEHAIKTPEFVRGGGGTAFGPAIEELSKFTDGDDVPPVSVIIYATDLMGSFGDAPNVPVMWAVPVRYANTDVPFGTIVQMEV